MEIKRIFERGDFPDRYFNASCFVNCEKFGFGKSRASTPSHCEIKHVIMTNRLFEIAELYECFNSIDSQ
jgi:hypothetical protein